MNNDTRISALLCNYNGASYLREAIEGVLTQSSPVDEFVMVDDGSTDESWEIMNEYTKGDPHLIKIAMHETNRGQGAAFNTGIALCSGEFVAFLDSDDVWFPDKIKEVRRHSEERCSFVLMQHRMQVMSDSQLVDEIFPWALAQGDLYRQWVERGTFPSFTPTSGLILSRGVLEKILPVPESFRISADSYITRSSISFGNVVSIIDPLAAYRKHGSNFVFENQKHSPMRFFMDIAGPELAIFYESRGMVVPPHVKRASRGRFLRYMDQLLDSSPRALMRSIQSRLGIS